MPSSLSKCLWRLYLVPDTLLEAGDTVTDKQIQSLSLCSWVQVMQEGTSTLLGLAPHHSATIMSEWHCWILFQESDSNLTTKASTCYSQLWLVVNRAFEGPPFVREEMSEQTSNMFPLQWMSNTRISRWVEGLIRLFGNYVLSTYFGSVAILGARDSAVNNKLPAIVELLFWGCGWGWQSWTETCPAWIHSGGCSVFPGHVHHWNCPALLIQCRDWLVGASYLPSCVT